MDYAVTAVSEHELIYRRGEVLDATGEDFIPPTFLFAVFLFTLQIYFVQYYSDRNNINLNWIRCAKEPSLACGFCTHNRTQFLVNQSAFS